MSVIKNKIEVVPTSPSEDSITNYIKNKDTPKAVVSKSKQSTCKGCAQVRQAVKKVFNWIKV